MRIARVFVLIILLSMGLVAGETPDTSSPPTEAKFENLLQMPLAEEFTPDREVIVSYVEIPPHTTLDRHWHPGEEFHYYLEGEVEIKIDGEPSVIGTPGTTGHVPYKKMHTAVAGKNGAKILVFRVHTKGEPWRYLEAADTTKQ